ncbi:hypothetical protein B0T16DRAFT_390160 [Cercophora newfieldiana]|uniref:Uncharacterized protein n=1 Tax=Cercophora newfieldiana TaxID=92897 RepID=A0AA39Y3W6_9PEZI|nr:hypothetical protein B0T16DRAFT_390160 [Cercophora newfieldiana]
MSAPYWHDCVVLRRGQTKRSDEESKECLSDRYLTFGIPRRNPPAEPTCQRLWGFCKRWCSRNMQCTAPSCTMMLDDRRDFIVVMLDLRAGDKNQVPEELRWMSIVAIPPILKPDCKSSDITIISHTNHIHPHSTTHCINRTGHDRGRGRDLDLPAPTLLVNPNQVPHCSTSRLSGHTHDHLAMIGARTIAPNTGTIHPM